MAGETMLGLLAGELSPTEGVTSGRVRVEGPPQALQHALALYGS